jgi:hypothetical protein
MENLNKFDVCTLLVFVLGLDVGAKRCMKVVVCYKFF